MCRGRSHGRLAVKGKGERRSSWGCIPGLNWPANYNFSVDDFHEADEMLVALAYVDEFVAQSDGYPISR